MTTVTYPPAEVAPPSAAEQDFSIVLGGPLFQLLRRAHLSDPALGLAHRRIVFAVAILWGPLAAFCALQGGLVGPGPRPFLQDIGFQLRFLVVVPVLILSELIVHRRMQPIIDEFRLRSLVRPSQTARFEAALTDERRWRNAILPEVVMFALVYAAGILFTAHRYAQQGGGGWYASPAEGAGLSAAGLWLVFVSVPAMQFLLLRWYFRLFIWASFLWRVSRLDLDLNVTHPDKVGGLGFLGDSLIAFVPLALAHGVLFTGLIADRILYTGAKLTDFRLEVLAGAVVLMVVFAGPLTIFGPRLARLKRRGLREFGGLGQTYVREFRRKWLEGGAPADEPLIGSGDIQSLADLGNSYSGADQMRIAPIRPSALIYFLIAFLAPIAPLLLTMMSVDKLVARLVGLVF
jgi:hypothetical protein